MIKTFIITIVLIAIYYSLKLQGIDLFAGFKNLLTKIKEGTTACTITLDMTLYDSLAKQAMQTIGYSTMQTKYGIGLYWYCINCLTRGLLLATPPAGEPANHYPQYQGVEHGSTCGQYQTPTGLAASQKVGQINSLVGQGLGLAGGIAKAAGALPVLGAISSIAGPIGLGIGIVASIFSAIIGAHAQKRANELQTVCQLIPYVNQSLLAVDNAFDNGSITADQASQEMDVLRQYAQNYVQSIEKVNASNCNTSCIIMTAIESLILLRQAIYTSCPSQVSNFIAQEQAA